MLTLAIQKSGRLSEATRKLLQDTGIVLNTDRAARLKAVATNFPMTVLFLRDDDIPDCVSASIADAGIIGENLLVEKEKPATVVEKLGFGRCRLSIAVPKCKNYTGIKDLNNKVIATSYPVILKRFLTENKISAKIHIISGSVEVSPEIGLSDAVFDIVSTGTTLFSHQLREVETVMESQAVLIADTKLDAKKSKILKQLQFRIQSVNKAKKFKYILLNTPNSSLEKIIELLPGVKSPTVLPLAMDNWSSVHTVIEEDTFWDKIESLKSAGAQGILVLPVEKMIL